VASPRPQPTAVTRLAIDLPADRLASRVGRWPGAALLESSPGFGEAGRWSVLAARPRLVLQATGTAWSLGDGDRVHERGAGDPLAALGRLLTRFRLADPGDADDPSGPPFQGGLIGYLGYDLAPTLERLPRRAPRDSGLPDLRFGLYDTFVVADRAAGSVVLEAHDLLGEGCAAVERRAGRWRSALTSNPVRPVRRSRLGPLRGEVDGHAYRAAVRRALEYIAAGDVFQVNLSQRFRAAGSVEPLDLYLRLKSASPAPYGAFLSFGDAAVVGASPESFYQTRGARIVTRPIKGTRPRGTSTADDDRLRAELAASPKDRAELTMIVDLERNDLGRVCEYGSVLVTDPLGVETFAQVHHLVATVEGRLRPGSGPIAVVRALFPGGSITGAPKIRAMEVIDELEPCRRGVYTGALGYFSRGGRSGFNIAIRTLVVEGRQVTYQVGGGIVADSDPDSEYQETLDKGRGLAEVLTGSGRSP